MNDYSFLEVRTTPTQYICDICGRTYKQKFYLREHIQAFHLSSFRTSCVLPEESETLRYASKTTDPSGMLRITLKTVDINTIHRWIEDYGRLNNAVYVRTSSKKQKNNTTVYYEQNHCQHYHEPKNESRKKLTKGRKCPSRIYVSVKTMNVTEITIKEDHNHPLDTSEILHYRKPSENVKSQFEELFNSGLGPTAAYNIFIDKIEKETRNDNEWILEHCDRSKVPDYPWVKKFFSKKCEKKYGLQNGCDQVINTLKTFLKDKYDFCRFKEIEDAFVIAIHTPLMQRVSSSPNAGELLYVDSVGRIDKYGFKVLPLIVNTNGGSCPVGVLIVTCETKEVISEGLSLYLTFVDEKSFGGRGQRGPRGIITNDCQAEIQALKDAFPEAALLLDTSHFLKGVYSWLFCSENKAIGNDRLLLYDLTKKMVHAETEKKLQILYSSVSTISGVEKDKVQNYFRKEYERRAQWALCFRYTEDVIARGSYANNCAETAICIIKDEILNGRSLLCPSQLVDYFTIAYDNHFKRMLINIAMDENCNSLKRKSNLDITDFEQNYAVDKPMENIYEVVKKNGKLRYYVDVENGFCSCHVGIKGGSCKHNKFITTKFGCSHRFQLLNSSVEKQNLYYLATGECMPLELFVLEEEVIFPKFEDDITIQDDIASGQDAVSDYDDNIANVSFGTKPVLDVDCVRSSFTSFMKEVDAFCKKFEGRADIAEALNQATIELRKLQNDTAAKVISAFNCFNHNVKLE